MAWAAFLVAETLLLLLWPGLALRLQNATANRNGTDSIQPIFWLHIPKSGTSFATTIVHATCGDAIPDDVVVGDANAFFNTWQAKCPKDRFLLLGSGHYHIQPQHLAHTVAMFRHPKQRVLSGYFAYPERLHDCKPMQEKYHCMLDAKRECDGDMDGHVTNPAIIPPKEYGDCVADCTTRMLTKRQCVEKVPQGPANLTLALENLEQLGFVGLTEEWELSMCLWHAKFGGRPLAVELQNTRPRPKEAHAFDEARLFNDWHNGNDEAVFEAAKGRFNRELEEYGVTKESCQQLFAPVLPQNQRQRQVWYDED